MLIPKIRRMERKRSIGSFTLASDLIPAPPTKVGVALN
jgi:hypothetical protein